MRLTFLIDTFETVSSEGTRDGLLQHASGAFGPGADLWATACSADLCILVCVFGFFDLGLWVCGIDGLCFACFGLKNLVDIRV